MLRWWIIPFAVLQVGVAPSTCCRQRQSHELHWASCLTLLGTHGQPTARCAWSKTKKTGPLVFYLRDCEVRFTGLNKFLSLNFQKTSDCLQARPQNSSPGNTLRYLLTLHVKWFSQPGSKGTKPMPDDLPVVLPIQIEEKRQSKVFTKNWQQAKTIKKKIWQPPEKQDLICELLTGHTHGQNFKQSVLQTNNSTTSSSCQSKACSFKHHHKKQHRENMQGNSTHRTKAWDTYLRDLPQKPLSIGE